MAVFNPNVPDPNVSDPNYLNYSRVVDAPPADKTAGMAFAAAGDALTGGVEIAEGIQKQIINDKVREAVETQRDAQTSALERIRSEQKAGLIPGGNPNGSLLDTGEEASSAPESLEASLDRADTIGAARAQGANRINDTYYTMNLSSLAKNLRNQYPGHKDYIDERFAKIAGMDPANAYYKNLMEDINRNFKVQQTPEQKAVKMGYALMQSGQVPNLYPYVQAVESGLPNAATNLFNYIDKWQSTKAIADMNQRRRTEQAGNREDDARDARESWNGEFRGNAANIANTPFAVTGMNQPQTIAGMISASASGKATFTSEQWGSLLMQAQNMKTQLTKFGSDLYDQRDYAKKWQNPKQMQEDLAANIVPIDALITAIRDKDVGTMFEVQRRIQNQDADFKYETLGGPLGGFFRTQQIAKEMGGDLLVGEVNRQMLTSDVWKNLKTPLGNMISRSWVPDAQRKDGVVKSLFKDVVAFQNANIPATSKVYDKLFDNIQNLKNPNVPDSIKQEIIAYAFNPENYKLMDRFQSDYVTDKGVTVPGKQSIFVRMTNPDMSEAIWKVSRNKPELWTAYKNWVEESGGKLFREDVVSLNELKDTRLKLGWNSDARRFELRGPNNELLPERAAVGSQRAAMATVRRVNWYISNLANVQDREGTDTAEYLLNHLRVSGFEPNENITGLPAQMIREIENSKKSTKQRFEESFK